MQHEPSITADASTTWLVLRCASSDTLALARALSNEDGRWGDHGAWTPVWKRRHRKPRSPRFELREVAAIPSFIFVPADRVDTLPIIPGKPYSLMRFDGRLVRIDDAQLDHLRKIDTQPRDTVKVLPKIGARIRFNDGPFQGLKGKVVYATHRYATVMVEGFQQPLKIPPSLCQEI